MFRLVVSFILLFVIGTFGIAQAQNGRPVTFVPPNYSSEQPSEGPSTAFSTEGRIAVADTVMRMIRVFETPALDAEIATLPFPAGLDFVTTIQAMGEVLTLTDNTGESWSIELPEVAIFSTNPLPQLAGERSSDGRISFSLNSGERLGVFEPEGVAILDWSLIGQVDSTSIVLLNESVGDDLRANIIRFQGGKVEPLYTFSWAPFDYVLDHPVHMDADGKLWVFALKNGIWAHLVTDVMLGERRLQADSPHSEFFEDRGDSESIPLLEYLAEKQRRIFNDAIQMQGPTDYEVVDEAMLTFADIAEFPLQAPSGIRRRDAVARALAYYTIPFFYRQRNYNDLGTGWQRPADLQGRSGTWQRGVRYY